jgi:hypothetical protein
MPMTVWPSGELISLGYFVASAANFWVPCDLFDAGTWAAIELTAFDGAADGVAVPEPEPLLQAAANRPTDSKTAAAVDNFL